MPVNEYGIEPKLCSEMYIAAYGKPLDSFNLAYARFIAVSTIMYDSVKTGLPRSGKSQGKSKIFQGQGKVREFCKRSGKISVLVKVSEMSGNFVFRFCEVYEDIFIRKKRSCSRSSYVFKWRVFQSVKCHAFKIP